MALLHMYENVVLFAWLIYPSKVISVKLTNTSEPQARIIPANCLYIFEAVDSFKVLGGVEIRLLFFVRYDKRLH